MKNISKLLSVSVNTETSTITIYDRITSDKLLDLNSSTIGLSGNEKDEEILYRVIEKYPNIDILVRNYEKVINLEDFEPNKNLYFVMVDQDGVNYHLVFAEDNNIALATVINHLFMIEHDDIQYIFSTDELEEDELDDFVSIDISSHVKCSEYEGILYLVPEYTVVFLMPMP